VKVINDYGDVPRWYWNSTAFLPLYVRRRKNIGRMVLATCLALAA
jgi:hypothetical protein